VVTAAADQAHRCARRSGGADGPKASDQRHAFERDRDRLLYSEYFRRLAGVTQVASASEGGVFHNRLTHSLKVAQVARRLAELLLHKHRAEHPALESMLSPDVVESAALAHDLGHPPFGHVADKRLCKLAEDNGLEDGFEGNAQTFRIVSRLSVRKGPASVGLDLTRATLAAIAKYPWTRARGEGADKKRKDKYSFFDDDGDAAAFAMDGLAQERPTLECQVMDLADAITYSVHDLEDFYCAGIVPIERLVRNQEYRRRFLERWMQEAPDDPSQKHAQNVQSWKEINGLLLPLSTDDVEPGSRQEGALLDRFRSLAISHFVGAVKFHPEDLTLSLPEPFKYQTKFLQRLIWDYVILSPRLATQQAGQLRIIDGLFEFFVDALRKDRTDRIPTRFRTDAAALTGSAVPARHQARFAIDIVATLTEAEAISLFKRVSGYDGGSVLDMIN
jgi:dGTPase